MASSPGGQDCGHMPTLSVPVYGQWQRSLHRANALYTLRRHFL